MAAFSSPRCEHVELLPARPSSRDAYASAPSATWTCTGAVESAAASVEDIIREVAAARVAERGGRADDKRSETSMEDRKSEGYF